LPNQFFLILKNIDKDKFHSFKKPQSYNLKTKEILDRKNSKYVFGLHNAVINTSIWNKIKKNDKIYLTVEKENFKISGIVSSKSKNLKWGEIVYPNSIDKKQTNHFLFFKNLEKTSISYSDLVRNYSKDDIYLEQGIHQIKEEFYFKKIKNKKSREYSPKKLPFEKTIGKAQRKRKNIESYSRNKNVKPLKILYADKCQIVQCGFRLKYVNEKGKYLSYSEVHHYNPLKNEGDDDWSNMVVLCPNHHAEFDFRTKFINSDKITITDENGKETGETIRFHKDHKFNKKNIVSNLEKLH
jgi:predicted restriction endonuclease